MKLLAVPKTQNYSRNQTKIAPVLDSISSSDNYSSESFKNPEVIQEFNEAKDSVPEPAQPVFKLFQRTPRLILVKPRIHLGESPVISEIDTIIADDSVTTTTCVGETHAPTIHSPSHTTDSYPSLFTIPTQKPKRFRPKKMYAKAKAKAQHVFAGKNAVQPMQVPSNAPLSIPPHILFQRLIPGILEKFTEMSCQWHESGKGCRAVIGDVGVVSVDNTILCCPAGYHSYNRSHSTGICTCIKRTCTYPYHLSQLRVCNDFRVEGSCSREGCLFGHRLPAVNDARACKVIAVAPSKKESTLDYFLRNCPELGPVLATLRDSGNEITTISNCEFWNCKLTNDVEHCKAYYHAPSVLNSIACPLGTFPHGCCAFDCKCKAPLRKFHKADGNLHPKRPSHHNHVTPPTPPPSPILSVTNLPHAI
jgi:hypothetical protein